MKMKTTKSILLKDNMKNLMTSLIPMIKKIKQIKSRVMKKDTI